MKMTRQSHDHLPTPDDIARQVATKTDLERLNNVNTPPEVKQHIRDQMGQGALLMSSLHPSPPLESAILGAFSLMPAALKSNNMLNGPTKLTQANKHGYTLTLASFDIFTKDIAKQGPEALSTASLSLYLRDLYETYGENGEEFFEFVKTRMNSLRAKLIVEAALESVGIKHTLALPEQAEKGRHLKAGGVWFKTKSHKGAVERSYATRLGDGQEARTILWPHIPPSRLGTALRVPPSALERVGPKILTDIRDGLRSVGKIIVEGNDHQISRLPVDLPVAELVPPLLETLAAIDTVLSRRT